MLTCSVVKIDVSLEYSNCAIPTWRLSLGSMGVGETPNCLSTGGLFEWSIRVNGLVFARPLWLVTLKLGQVQLTIPPEPLLGTEIGSNHRHHGAAVSQEVERVV